MSSPTRRALTIDDPVAAAAACHVAHPAGEAAAGRLQEIALDEIHPNAAQPRKRFDQASLDALADSIRERGVLQPIIVAPRSARGYQLIAGERRWRAAQIAGRPTIPALVGDAVDGAVSLELALIENVAREDLTVIEEARTIASLLDDLHITTPLLARRLGRSRSDLAHTVRLPELPDEAIELLDDGALTKGHGKALLTEPDHHRRRDLAERAAERGWSVRALEAEIAQHHRPHLARPTRIPIKLPPPPSSTSSSLGQPGATSRHARTASGISLSSTRAPSTGLPRSFNPPLEPIDDAGRPSATARVALMSGQEQKSGDVGASAGVPVNPIVRRGRPGSIGSSLHRQFNRELGEVGPSEAIVRGGTVLRSPSTGGPARTPSTRRRGHRRLLAGALPDFRRAYAHDGLSIGEFDG